MEAPSTSQPAISFRFTWPLKVSQRLLSSGERAVLNVSPSFCTASNGVQFTWLLRLCDNVVVELAEECDEEESKPSQRLANVTLYYKDGPCRDISLTSASVSIVDAENKSVYSDMPLECLEYTKGAGWSPSSGNSAEELALSDFVHSHVGKQIKVVVELKLKQSWFEPLGYLPELPDSNNALEQLCTQVLDEISLGALPVPDLEFFDEVNDRYAMHRHVFVFGCKEVRARAKSTNRRFSTVQVENVFSHLYFDQVIQKEAEFFEDYVDILAASPAVHFPALKRECERFICQEVMLESADLAFVKKMVVLAERFDLRVLKMVAFGVLVDRILQASGDGDESVDDIRAELMQFAEQIQNVETDGGQAEDACDSGLLADAVVDQLEDLARHIRKVSMHSTGQQAGVAPFCSSPGPFPAAARRDRRSSLKTSRELLLVAAEQPDQPDFGRRRRSVMFALPRDQPASLTGSSCSSLSSGSPVEQRLQFGLDQMKHCTIQQVHVYQDQPAFFSS